MFNSYVRGAFLVVNSFNRNIVIEISRLEGTWMGEMKQLVDTLGC
jgi:hypothetical protein